MAASITLPNAASDDRDQARPKQASLSSQASARTGGDSQLHGQSPHVRIEFGAFRGLVQGVGVTGPTRSGVPLPAKAISFTFAITTSSGPILANVGSISVASNQPVDPPHSTAAEWNTAVWVKQSAYPSAQSAGTSYIYGHACHHHQCPFTRLKDARVGICFG